MMASDQMAPGMEASSGLDFGQVLKRRKLLLVIGLAIGAGLAYLYFIRQPPVYQSVSRVMLTRKKGQGLPLQTAGFAVKDSLANELLLIRSEELLKTAMEMGELEKLPTFGSGPGSLLRGLQVDQIDATDVLQLSFKGSRAQDCRAAVASITDAYKQHVEDSKNQSHDEIKSIINDAVNSVSTELRAREAAYEEFHQRTALQLSAGEAVNPHAERMALFASKETSTDLEENRINALIRTIEAARAEGGNQAALQLLVDQLAGGAGGLNRANQVVNTRPGGEFRSMSLTQELFQLSMQLAQAKEQYGARHPRVLDLERQERFMKNFLLKQESTASVEGEVVAEEPVDFVSAYLNRLNLQLATLRQEKEKVRSMMVGELEKSKALQTDVVKNDNFKNEISRLRDMHSELRQRLKDVSLVQTYEGRQAAIIAPASVASQVGPDFVKIMTIGSVLGLLAGFGLACLIELADKSFRSPDDLMAELGIPVLSHIPFMREAKKRKGGAGSSVGNALITVLRPKSRTAEAYRSVRTALYFSTSGEVNKIVQVTSPVAGDGKSTLAGNLAVAIANSGKRVLLVDADLRRPTVHKVFGINNKNGVSTVVSGVCQLEDACHATEVENLTILTCGPRPDNPSEMLLSPEFEQLLEYVRAAFDFVVIDSPPILAVTDPASVAARADGVIVTLRLAKRSRDLAKRAVDQLQNVGANILGVVVNGVDSVESYGYRSYSYGGYGYGGYGQGYGGYYANQSGYYDEGTKQPSAPKRGTAVAAERTNGKR
jgi:capsular exopolysaccharide synthesis family protein